MKNKRSDSDLPAYRAKITEVFRDFTAICEEHNISYFCCGGTAIGALRHKGLIPWDDDIDVLMPRPDYERFLALVPQLDQDKYEVVIPGEDASYYLPFAKICDKSTTLLEFKHIPCVYGAYVDIFPLDGASDSAEQRALDSQRFRRLANKLMILPKPTMQNFIWLFDRLFKFQLRTAWNEITCAFGKKGKYKEISEEVRYIMTRNTYAESEYVGSYGSRYGVKAFWRKEWFNDHVIKDFEGIPVRLPVGYDSMLSQIFGDYMQLPPKDKQISHHDVAYLNLEERLSVEEVMERLK